MKTVRRRLITLLAACLIVSGASVASAGTRVPPPAEELNPLAVARAFEKAIKGAAEKVSPAVVNITTTRELTVPFGLDDLPEGIPEELRKQWDKQREGRPMPRTRGNGSGVVISSDGYILTAEHVVREALEITVTLSSRRQVPAEVVGADPRRDLAVIRIDAENLPAANLGDADKLRRGQFVLALGSPFGFGRDGQSSLSFGVVSGTGRFVPGIGRELDRYYGNLIQSDAAINPGNSGGPLINLSGEVVGINAVISTRDGSSDGVGFAVPITDVTRGIVERLKKGEEIEYGFVGIEMHEVTEVEAEAPGVELGRGAYVSRVMPDTPAAKAGLKPGDVIVAIGDDAITGPDDLVQIVQATPVGHELEMTVVRGGKRRALAVATMKRPDPEKLLAGLDRNTWWRGMRVVPLTEAVRESADLDPKQQGVVIGEIRDGTPAAKAGLRAGMVIDQVGDKKVDSVREFRARTEDLEGPAFVHVVGEGVKVIKPEVADDGSNDDGDDDEDDDKKK